MDNQITNNQMQEPTPEQKVVTLHAEPKKTGHLVLFAVIAAAALIASAGIMVFINNNKPSSSAAVNTSTSLNNSVTKPTLTPTPTVMTEEPDEAELNNIEVEDVDGDLSDLDADLNKL